MKTANDKAKTSYKFERSTYNPALDHMMGKVYFKEKMEEARAFLKAHPIPKEFFEEFEREKELSNK
jgi:hypothetical protein